MGNYLSLSGGGPFGSNDDPVVDLDEKSGVGPCGKGNPEDLTLRERELLINIPRYQATAARAFVCADLNKIFRDCCDDHTLSFIACRSEMNEFLECVHHWSHDAEYRKIITEEYLQVRSAYRKTGRRRLYRALKGETYITETQLKNLLP